jgi:hypothetical protein
MRYAAAGGGDRRNAAGRGDDMRNAAGGGDDMRNTAIERRRVVGGRGRTVLSARDY